jgi:hypothetical protein
MYSWADAVFDRAHLLSGDRASSAAMQTAFRRIAGEWSEHACAHSPIDSGMTADGAPVEISARFGSDQSGTELRFIAQPGLPSGSPAVDRAFTAGRARSFIGEESGTEAAKVVDKLLACFPSQPAHRSGNLFLWLGQDFGKKPSTKIYFNPWAAAPQFQIVPLLEHALQAAGLGSCVDGLSRLSEFPAKPLVSLIGLNLDRCGVTSVKLYFVIHTTLDALVVAASLFSQSEGFIANMRRAVGHNGRRGEVHGAIVWSRDHPVPQMRASLYCPDWFCSDQSVAHTVAANLGYMPFGKGLYATPPQLHARWFSFLGVDDKHLTLYSLVR